MTPAYRVLGAMLTVVACLFSALPAAAMAPPSIYDATVYAYDAPALLPSPDTLPEARGSPSGPGAGSWVSPLSVLDDVDAANTARAGAADGLAGRTLNVNGQTVTYSERVIARAAGEPGPFHNFPAMYDDAIIGQGARTVVPSGYTQYSLPGTINGRAGVYEIGGWPNAAGNAFEITHRFFRPGG
ncbi:hypothetical protein [Actinotalea sp. K2]|uniref:hypothetical protein n=1 Tax=Actinotalea sp. K2 TaxID=2939438 RepID=UPI002016AF89|nr:hypothetical protein [Actinotalea sp. K2]MCL3862095.1 hypothetical protein [Actinotalea sp. K2]